MRYAKRYRSNDLIISEIKWTKTDIENMLKENECNCSVEVVNELLADFDICFLKNSVFSLCGNYCSFEYNEKILITVFC